MLITCIFQNTSFGLFKIYSRPRLNKSRLKSAQILLSIHNIGQSETSGVAGQWRSWYLLQIVLSVEELSTISQAIWSCCLNFAECADVENIYCNHARKTARYLDWQRRHKKIISNRGYIYIICQQLQSYSPSHF